MKILLIDADESEYGIVKQILAATTDRPFELFAVESVNEATKVLWDEIFDLILLDADINSDFAMMDASSIIKAHARSQPSIFLSTAHKDSRAEPDRHDNFFQAVDKYDLQKRLPAFLKNHKKLKTAGNTRHNNRC